MLSIVLSRRDWREADQIITFFTQECGKVEARAAGIKKILSKNSAMLAPGNIVEAEIIAGKENYILGGVELRENWRSIKKNLASQLFLQWSLDFVSALVHKQERDIRIFNLLCRWLKFLDNTKMPSVKLADQFVARLLACLGFDPAHDKTINNHKSLYNFTVYTAEKNLGDWGNIAKISQNIV